MNKCKGTLVFLLLSEQSDVLIRILSFTSQAYLQKFNVQVTFS